MHTYQQKSMRLLKVLNMEAIILEFKLEKSI